MVAAIRMSIDRFNEPVMIEGSPEEDSSQSGKRSRAYWLVGRGRSSMTAPNSGQRRWTIRGYQGGAGFTHA